MWKPKHARSALLVAVLLCTPAAAQDAPAASEVAPPSQSEAAPPVASLPPVGADLLRKNAPKAPPLEEMKGYSATTDEGLGDFVWSFVRSMLMLGAVLALIYLVLHKGLGKLVQRTQSSRRMRVVERIALDQRRALYMVEVDGEQMLLAGTDGGVTRVDRAGEGDAPAATKPFTTDVPKSVHPPLSGVLAREDAAGDGLHGPNGNGHTSAARAATEA